MTFLFPVGSHCTPETTLWPIIGCRPQDEWPAAVFYPFGHPTPIASVTVVYFANRNFRCLELNRVWTESSWSWTGLSLSLTRSAEGRRRLQAAHPLGGPPQKALGLFRGHRDRQKDRHRKTDRDRQTTYHHYCKNNVITVKTRGSPNP
jgi:hypothetical protein